MKRYLYLLVAFCIVGCVDKDIDLGNVQGNIGITSSQQLWGEEAGIWRDQMSEFAKQIIREAVNLVTYAVEGV